MIVYIHGAHMTSAAFNYIKTNLPEHELHNVEYSALSDLEDTVARIRRELKLLDKPFKIISHSLGGVIGLRMLQGGLPVERLLTISSPLGGVDLKTPFMNTLTLPIVTNFLPDEVSRFLTFTKQIHPDSKTFRDLHSSDFDNNKVFSIITNMGRVFSGDETDMVVSVKSQKHYPEIAHEEIECSHTEILVRPETVRIIKRELL